MAFRLYHHPISTCSQKVRLALAEKRVDYGSVVVEFSRQDHLSDWYLRINPNGVVPSLEHDGRVVVDSSVICEYLDEVLPEPALSPPDPLGRAEMRAWMRYSEEVPTAAIRVPSFNDAFLPAGRAMGAERFDAMTGKMPLRRDFYRQMGLAGFSADAYDASLARLRSTLERVSARLGDGRDWLLGDLFSIADIVLVPSVVRMVDLRLSRLWDDLPLVAAWLDRVEARPAFATAYAPGARIDPDSFWRTGLAMAEV